MREVYGAGDEYIYIIPFLLTYFIYWGIAIIASLVKFSLGLWSLAKIFKKAGEPFWKIFIPFYNMYTIYDFSWSTKFYWLELVFAIGIIIFNIISIFFSTFRPGIFNFSLEYGFNKHFIQYLTVLGIVVLCSLAVFIIRIFLYRNVSKAFGGDVWLWVGLIFFPNLFAMYLGFSSQKYIGNIYKKERVA